MVKTIGEQLDDPNEYRAWLQHSATAYAAILAVGELGLLKGVDEAPATLADIAVRSFCPEDLVRRLLGFLAAEGALEIDEEGVVRATQRTRTMIEAKRQYNGRLTLEAAFALPEAIRTGTTAFEARFGMPPFDYFKANPELGRIFGAVMAETTIETERFIFTRHRFEPFACAVDVGGNRGSLLVRLLDANPQARGILFDLPETIAEASGLGERVECIGGSFFESVPAGGDLYLLKQILHDWNDSDCRAILRNVRAAMRQGSRLAVIERLLPEHYEPHNAFVLDVVMLLWTHGRERKLSEFEAMFKETGFRLDRVSQNPEGMSVIEAVPA